MKVVLASGVQSRPARGGASHRDWHAHCAILKTDRQHCGAGGVRAVEKAHRLLRKSICTIRPRKKSCPSKPSMPRGAAGLICRRSKAGKSPMSGTSPTVATNPWTQRALAPPSTPTAQAGAPSFSFSLRAASKFRALMLAPESSTNRSGLLGETALTFRQISPSRNSNGISAPGLAQADNCKKTAVSGSRRNQKNTRASCNASDGISTRRATICPCWINSTPNGDAETSEQYG